MPAVSSANFLPSSCTSRPDLPPPSRRFSPRVYPFLFSFFCVTGTLRSASLVNAPLKRIDFLRRSSPLFVDVRRRLRRSLCCRHLVNGLFFFFLLQCDSEGEDDKVRTLFILLCICFLSNGWVVVFAVLSLSLVD